MRHAKDMWNCELTVSTPEMKNLFKPSNRPTQHAGKAVRYKVHETRCITVALLDQTRRSKRVHLLDGCQCGILLFCDEYGILD